MILRHSVPVDCTHLCMKVGQVKKCAGHADRYRLVAVERVKPDPRVAFGIADIGAHIQFQKIREKRNGREQGRADPAHEKRHNAQPGLSFKGIHNQAIR